MEQNRFFRNTCLLSLLLIQLGFKLAVYAADSYEPDNGATAARPVIEGETQTHSIDQKGDVDWLQFRLTQKSEITLETNGTSGDTLLSVFGPNDPTTLIETS